MAITQAASRMISDLNAGSTYVAASAKKVFQTVHASTSALVTGTTTTPADDTIPQNTEGNEVLTAAITPTAAATKLLIEAIVLLSPDALGDVTLALFQDSTANALAVVNATQRHAGDNMVLSFRHYMTSGTVSATTFKIRAGQSGAGTLSVNGAGGARIFGGVASTTLTITEVAA